MLIFVKTWYTRPMLTMIVRTVVVFSALIVLMRLLGKRQLGELELSELVVSILIADLASIPLQDPSLPIWYGLGPCVTLFLCESLLARVTMESVSFRRLICGQPCFLVIRGVIQQKNMRKSRFTVDELAEELRKNGVTDIATVEYAVLETDGTLNVILFPAHRPVTAAQLKLAEEDEGYGIVVAEEGVLLEANLRAAGKDRRWLEEELARRGVSSVRDVYALIVFTGGRVFFAPRER